MTEKEQENIAIVKMGEKGANAPVPAPANTAQLSAQTEDEKKTESHNSKPSPGMSPGEKKFNFWTYFGLNYVVNLVASVALADIAINGAGMLNKSLKYSIEKSTRFFSKFVHPRTAHYNSKVGLETFSLLTGGSILLVPLKYIEDNKRKIVHRLNERMGVDQTAPDGHKETPEEIHIEKEQPKQSYPNLIWRRIMGTIAVISSGLAIDHIFKSKTDMLDAKTYEIEGMSPITYDKKAKGGKQVIEDKAFGFINRTIEKVSGKKFNPNGMVGRWTKLAILDSMFTVITAVVMKVTNGAKRAKMPNEIDDSHDPAVIKDEVDMITTTADLNNRKFASKIEKRVDKLVDFRSEHAGSKKSFVETLQQAESPVLSHGV